MRRMLSIYDGWCDSSAEGAMNFVNPYLTESAAGMENYLNRHNIADINEIIGCVK